MKTDQLFARVACLLCITLVMMAPLDASTPGKGGNASPAAPPFGRTYDVLSQEWWLWDFMLNVFVNPTLNSSASCANGQSGNVWFLPIGPQAETCNIPAGTMLFVPIEDVECSSLEPFPFHGDTPQERQACAKAWVDNFTDLAVTIDGTPIQNLAPLRARSGDFSFTVPNDNIIVGSGPAWGFSSADGYYVLLAPLAAGNHTIHTHATVHDSNDPAHPVLFVLDTLITLHVQ